jgi:biopolymer transport protein ExbB
MFSVSSSGVVNASLALLLVFSVITWTLIFAKGWLQLQLGRQNEAFKRRFWEARDMDDAASFASSAEGALARISRTGFEALKSLREGAGGLMRMGGAQDFLERSLRTQVEKEQHRLEAGLILLASIGSTAPFVGLFGTVWGIMHALQAVHESGSAGLDVVAGPVGEALIATAIGIATAVPAVLAYNYGVRRVRLLAAELEHFANDFMQLAVKSSSDEAPASASHSDSEQALSRYYSSLKLGDAAKG